MIDLEDVLLRPRFREVASVQEAHAYVEALAREALLVRDPEELPPFTADRGDDYLVALALAVAAEAIVSGDKHLTELVDPPVPVLTPRELLGGLGRR